MDLTPAPVLNPFGSGATSGGGGGGIGGRDDQALRVAFGGAELQGSGDDGFGGTIGRSPSAS